METPHKLSDTPRVLTKAEISEIEKRARIRDGLQYIELSPRERDALCSMALENARLRKALERSVVAIDDWLNTYASDLCDQTRVMEARHRIAEKGTLAYIADVQKQNRAALKGSNG